MVAIGDWSMVVVSRELWSSARKQGQERKGMEGAFVGYEWMVPRRVGGAEEKKDVGLR